MFSSNLSKRRWKIFKSTNPSVILNLLGKSRSRNSSHVSRRGRETTGRFGQGRARSPWKTKPTRHFVCVVHDTTEINSIPHLCSVMFQCCLYHFVWSRAKKVFFVIFLLLLYKSMDNWFGSLFRFRSMIIKVIIVLLIALLFGLFLYSAPGLIMQKILGV